MATEKQCTKCGKVKLLSEFYKRDSGKHGVVARCKECQSAYSRRRYLSNRDETIARVKKYAASHRDEKVAYDKEYRKNNAEKCSANCKHYREGHLEELAEYYLAWSQENHDKIMVNGYRSRARKSGAVIEDFDELSVWQYWGETCAYCGSTEDLTLDHIVPLSQGGPHSFDNLCVACRSCNASKGAKKLIEWMWHKARLCELSVSQ